MKLIGTSLAGAYIVESVLHRDQRGTFMEVFSSGAFASLGIETSFVQDNFSLSRQKGVVRGLHFQRDPYAQAKLVWTVTGALFDVIVDMRPGSETYLRWESFVLEEERPLMVFVPRGFAHGFCTLRDDTRVFYKVDAPYSPASEGGLRWDDPDLAIPWPTRSPMVSDKDARLPSLRDLGLT
jgi:dTDP-4-dehydrorhamnose 3,5-epimerase